MKIQRSNAKRYRNFSKRWPVGFSARGYEAGVWVEDVNNELMASFQTGLKVYSLRLRAPKGR